MTFLAYYVNESIFICNVTMTKNQVLQSIIDYADYETDATGERCQRYITSVRRLIFLTAQQERIGGEEGIIKQYDLVTLNSMLNTALKFLATTSNYGGVGSAGGQEEIIMGGVFDNV